MTPRSRRDFLLSAGVFAAGAMMAPSEGSHAIADDRNEATKPSPQPPPKAQGVVQPISAGTVAQAERLAGVEFTDAERQMIAQSIGEQLEILAKRQRHPLPPNGLGPAQVFDPRLVRASERLPANHRGTIERSEDDPGPLPKDDDDVAFAPVTKLARWIERRQLSSAQLTEIYLDRLKRFDGPLKCVITLCEARARKRAARADAEIAAGLYRGPLHGIPWGAKDLLDTAGIRTTWGAEPFVDRVPDSDAAVVKKLDEAGAILVAKLSLGALAYNDMWFGGRTNNPWNLEQGSSGSSAGSAAATAAGMVGFSIGTETYGSIVSPCMRCGTTGLRPTFGRVSRAGAMALCWSLDKIGPICRAVEDCALVLAAINGYDGNDPSSIDMPLHLSARSGLIGLRLGYSPQWFAGKDANDLDRAALEALRRTGVKLVEIDWPDWPYDVLINGLLCEAAAAFEGLTRTNRDDELSWQDAEAWPNTFRKSWFIPGIEYVQADRFRRQCMHMMDEQFKRLHAMIGPSFAGSLCLVSNNTGHPSLTIRSGFKDDGTPHGITLIGRLFDEGTLCRIGTALERELNVWERRPKL
ncbi:MAG: amidase [Phycisphaerales bacterium]|nr:amidase [Phycisphaerales bacterium]MCI0675784.1 amidase [Phycisphaerales bacterium]